MSNSNYYSVVEALEAQLRGTVYEFESIKLSDRDARLVQIALTIQFLLIRDLLPSSIQDRAERCYRGSILQKIDVSQIHRTIQYFDGIFKEYPAKSCLNVKLTYANFKRMAKDEGCLMMFLEPIRPIVEDYFDCPSPASFRILNTWTNCLGRLNLKDVDFATAEWDEYKADEALLQSLVYDIPSVDAVEEIITEWFSSPIEYDIFVPNHGPGTVAEAKNRRQSTRYFKYHVAAEDQLLRYLSRDIGNISDYFVGPPIELKRVSRMVFVPKKMGKRRAISAEPASLQFFQQGYRALWYRVF